MLLKIPRANTSPQGLNAGNVFLFNSIHDLNSAFTLSLLFVLPFFFFVLSWFWYWNKLAEASLPQNCMQGKVFCQAKITGFNTGAYRWNSTSCFGITHSAFPVAAVSALKSLHLQLTFFVAFSYRTNNNSIYHNSKKHNRKALRHKLPLLCNSKLQYCKEEVIGMHHKTTETGTRKSKCIYQNLGRVYLVQGG